MPENNSIIIHGDNAKSMLCPENNNNSTPLNPQYNILYCDPPWKYHVWGKKGASSAAENHYPTMPLADICALSVGSIAAQDSALFLWVTCPNLQQSFEVIKAWGFTYKTVAFVWIKKNKKADSLFWGLGHWTRANAELCLLATKGNPRRVSKSVHQVIMTPIEAHSKKPDEARARIVELMGDLPRIELFARNYTEGWDVWGNEINSSIALTGQNINLANRQDNYKEAAQGRAAPGRR